MLVPIRQLGAVGVISPEDFPPAELPLNAFTSSDSIQFRNGAAAKEPGWRTLLRDFVSLPLWFQFWANPDADSTVFGTATGLYATPDLETVTAVTTQTAAGAATTPSTATAWQSDVFGKFCVMNNQVDTPFYSYSFSTPTWTFRKFPGWGAATSPGGAVRAIRAFRNHLFALGVTGSDTTVYCSDQGTPEAFPTSWDYADTTKLARRFPLSSSDGPIVDGFVLGDRLIVYQQNAATAVEYVGGSIVFGARRLFGYGLINRDACVQIDNWHFGVSGDAIFLHDGSRIQRPADKRVERRFFSEVTNQEQVFVAKNDKDRLAIIYYASGSTYPNRTLTFNWAENTWAFGSLGTEIRRIDTVTYEPPAPTWTEALATGVTWAQAGGSWLSSMRTGTFTDTFQLQESTLNVRNGAFTRDGSAEVVFDIDGTDTISWDGTDDLLASDVSANADYDAYIERTYLDLDELTKDAVRIKYTKGVYLELEGSGKCDVQFGVSKTVRDPPKWGTQKTIDFTTEQQRVKVDLRLTGRFLHYRIGSWGGTAHPGAWRLPAMDLDIKLEGLR
jgi:hypothetical protein